MVLRVVRHGLEILLAGAGILYGFDYLSAKYGIPGNRQVFDTIRVDQLYTVPNKWGEIEWSHGDPVMERCVYALFPHFGSRPCWYVKRHTMNTNRLSP